MKMLRKEAHSREEEICRKRPRSAQECAKAHSFLCTGKFFYNTKNIKEQMFENNLQNEWNCDMLITEKNKHMFDI